MAEEQHALAGRRALCKLRAQPGQLAFANGAIEWQEALLDTVVLRAVRTRSEKSLGRCKPASLTILLRMPGSITTSTCCATGTQSSPR